MEPISNNTNAISNAYNTIDNYFRSLSTGDHKISFAALFDKDGKAAQVHVPPVNTGSIYNYGFAQGSSQTASTNVE